MAQPHSGAYHTSQPMAAHREFALKIGRKESLRERVQGEIRVGSRESRLAVIQSEIVIEYIRKRLPQAKVRLITMKTTGDKILDRPLAEIGGKGLFVKELDAALLKGRIDLSVHSLKDLPMVIPDALPLAAFSAREDPRDVLVLPKGVNRFDSSLPVGCSSRRRMLQFQKLYPQASFAPVRGNVQTRLRKLDGGQYGALLLAAAGLKRLGMENRISRYFEPEEMLPAAGQGILAVQVRSGENYSWLDNFQNPAAAAAAAAERSFVRELGGGCSAPTAAYAAVEGDSLVLTGMEGNETSGQLVRRSIRGTVSEAEELGRALALEIRVAIDHGR